MHTNALNEKQAYLIVPGLSCQRKTLCSFMIECQHLKLPSNQIFIMLNFVFWSVKVVAAEILRRTVWNVLDQLLNTVALLVVIKRVYNITYHKCWGSYWTMSSSKCWLLGMRNIVYPPKSMAKQQNLDIRQKLFTSFGFEP